MNRENQEITISRIINLPIENGQVADIAILFQFNPNKNSHRISGGNIGNVDIIYNLIQQQRFELSKAYECKFLFCIDEHGNQYTLYDVSYTIVYHGTDIFLDICYNMVLYGGHIKCLDNILVDKVEFEVDYSKPISIKFTYGGFQIISEPQYESTPEILEWMGETYKGLFTKKVRFSLSGKREFDDYEKTIWRLSEFFLLCNEDMFFHDGMVVYIGDDSYLLKNFTRANNASIRKKVCIRVLCHQPIFFAIKHSMVTVFLALFLLGRIAELYSTYLELPYTAIRFVRIIHLDFRK